MVCPANADAQASDAIAALRLPTHGAPDVVRRMWGRKDLTRGSRPGRNKMEGPDLEDRLRRVPSDRARFGKSWISPVGFEDHAKRIDLKTWAIRCTATGWVVRR
jgi:hypothetical protein